MKAPASSPTPYAPVIIGAGPAGIRAAEALAKAGLRPVVLDEGLRSGGQIYRRPSVDDGRSYRSRYGSEAGRAEDLHTTFDALHAAIDYRPETLVWNIASQNGSGRLDIICNGTYAELPFSHLLLATGATDRVLPFKGWTTPGVYTLGAAQTALKAQGCTVGQRIAFMGSGPLLYLVAWQYLQAGADVVAVLDTAPIKAKAHLARLGISAPRIVALGASYGVRLMMGGVPIHYGVRPDEVIGNSHVKGLRFNGGGKSRVIDCDAIAFGFGLRPETQLADLAGCAFRFEPRDRAWLPEVDDWGRSSREGIYVAGDGGGIAGADAAEIRGELAAYALLQDLGRAVDKGREAKLLAKLKAIYRQRLVIEDVFPFPHDWFETVDADVTLCRCEEISVREASETIDAGRAAEINRLKALTRVGMGRCQGRMCSAAASELLGSKRQTSAELAGRLRAQAPVKPIPFGLGADKEARL